MSLKALPVPPIPDETARIARAPSLTARCVCSGVTRWGRSTPMTDAAFADLFPTSGQPAEAPWRLALVTVLQFVEGLPTGSPASCQAA